MISDFFINLVDGVLVACPVLALPAGFSQALDLFCSLISFINIFVPLVRVAPIFLLIVGIRNWNIIISIARFILRFIPFVG